MSSVFRYFSMSGNGGDIQRLLGHRDRGAAIPLHDMVEAAIATMIGQGSSTDATIAASEAQRIALWRLRESFSEAQKCEGASLKHDVSVPVDAIPR